MMDQEWRQLVGKRRGTRSASEIAGRGSIRGVMRMAKFQYLAMLREVLPQSRTSKLWDQAGKIAILRLTL